MTIQEYVFKQLQMGLQKYGFTETDLNNKAAEYTYNLIGQHEIDELTVDMKGFLDERLPDLIDSIKQSNVFKYPIIDTDYELRFVLETTLTRGEVDAVLRGYDEESEMDFIEYMESNGIAVIGGFEKSIAY